MTTPANIPPVPAPWREALQQHPKRPLADGQGSTMRECAYWDNGFAAGYHAAAPQVTDELSGLSQSQLNDAATRMDREQQKEEQAYADAAAPVLPTPTLGGDEMQPATYAEPNPNISQVQHTPPIPSDPASVAVPPADKDAVLDPDYARPRHLPRSSPTTGHAEVVKRQQMGPTLLLHVPVNKAQYDALQSALTQLTRERDELKAHFTALCEELEMERLLVAALREECERLRGDKERMLYTIRLAYQWALDNVAKSAWDGETKQRLTTEQQKELGRLLAEYGVTNSIHLP